MKKNKYLILLFVIILVLVYFYGARRIDSNKELLRDAMTDLAHREGDIVTLEEVIPFDWTGLYVMDPYTSTEDIKDRTGISSVYLIGYYNEGCTLIVANRGHLAVCDYEYADYYDFDFIKGDGISSGVEINSDKKFRVSLNEGKVIKLDDMKFSFIKLIFFVCIFKHLFIFEIIL